MKIIIAGIMIFVMSGCYVGYVEKPKSYVKRCKSFSLKGREKRYNRRGNYYYRVERELKRCLVCDWNNNCNWEDRYYYRR